MKKSTLFILFIALCPLLFVGSAKGQNLVNNGGGESGPHDTAYVNGWVTISGGWFTTDDPAGAVAQEGSHYFEEGEDSVGVLQQDVDVSTYATAIDLGTKQFLFSGYVYSYDQDPPDQGSFYVQCLDQTKANVLSSYFTDTISSVNTWFQVAHWIVAPINTRYIRIQLVATRRTGLDNDGYFDNISLTPGFPTGVQTQQGAENAIQVFPVPAAATVMVQVPDVFNGCDIKLVNMQGAVITQMKGNSGANNINVSNIANGYYILSLSKDGTTVHRKVSVVH